MVYVIFCFVLVSSGHGRVAENAERERDVIGDSALPQRSLRIRGDAPLGTCALDVTGNIVRRTRELNGSTKPCVRSPV